MAWHLDGFSTAEIAESMGLEQAAVLQNLSRARRTLKQQLERAPDDELGLLLG